MSILFTPTQVIDTEKCILQTYRYGNDAPTKYRIIRLTMMRGNLGGQAERPEGEPWIFEDATGVQLYSNRDYPAAEKYRLTLDDLRQYHWQSVQDEGNLNAVAERRAQQKKDADAREYAELITYLKRHGTYDRWQAQKKRQSEESYNYRVGAESELAAQRREYRMMETLHRKTDYTFERWGHDEKNAYAYTYRLKAKSDGGYDLDGKYSGTYTIDQLEKLLGLPSPDEVRDFQRRKVRMQNALAQTDFQMHSQSGSDRNADEVYYITRRSTHDRDSYGKYSGTFTLTELEKLFRVKG